MFAVGPKCYTYNRLDPVRHTEDVGMPVIVGSAIVGHDDDVVNIRT